MLHTLGYGVLFDGEIGTGRQVGILVEAESCGNLGPKGFYSLRDGILFRVVVFLIFVKSVVVLTAAIATDVLDEWGDNGHNKDGSGNWDDGFARGTGLW